MMHSAHPSLRALPEPKKKKKRIKVIAIFSVSFFMLDLKATLDLVSLKYE